MTVITTITTSGTESTWAERMHLDCSKQYMYFGNVYTVNYIPLEVECGSLPSRKKQAVDETKSFHLKWRKVKASLTGAQN